MPTIEIKVRFGEQTHEFIAAEAQRAGMSLSQYVAEAAFARAVVYGMLGSTPYERAQVLAAYEAIHRAIAVDEMDHDELLDRCLQRVLGQE